MTDSPWMTRAAAAAYLSVHVNTLDRLRADGAPDVETERAEREARRAAA